jgi:hypothetical protein
VPILFLSNNGDGEKKLFLISETEKKQLPLKDDIIKLNDDNTVIVITPDGARFSENNCPNKTCIKSGWVKDCGDIAACVPYKLTLIMECKEEEIDAISR